MSQVKEQDYYQRIHHSPFDVSKDKMELAVEYPEQMHLCFEYVAAAETSM